MAFGQCSVDDVMQNLCFILISTAKYSEEDIIQNTADLTKHM